MTDEHYEFNLVSPGPTAPPNVSPDPAAPPNAVAAGGYPDETGSSDNPGRLVADGVEAAWIGPG